MKTYALITNGVVTELIITAQNIAKMFHVGLDWRDVTGVTVAIAPPPEAAASQPPAQSTAVTTLSPSGAISSSPEAVTTHRPVQVGDVVSSENGFAAPVVQLAPKVPTFQQLQTEIGCLEARIVKLEASRH